AVSVAPQISSGAIKAYGVSARERLAILPDVPTAKEAGIDYEMSIWAGIFAAKGTPKDIVDKLARALDQALDDPGVKKRLADLGASLPTKDERTPAKFDVFVKAEIARWSPILKAATPRRSERKRLSLRQHAGLSPIACNGFLRPAQPWHSRVPKLYA